MKIAIASGKGGTGKTTVATNLAQLAAENGCRTVYVDCDVEAPNGHLFLRPEIHIKEPVTVPVPEIDATVCNHCGACARFCQYNALLCLPSAVMVFPELCHGCGGCRMVCPMAAIKETVREIGQCFTGQAGKIGFASGCLNIGEAKSPPLIRAVKNRASGGDLVWIDAPPGTSCPVVESLRDCDFVVLVTEPTPFGLHDLGLAVAMVRQLHVPCGVVINRAAENDGATLDFCTAQNLPVLTKIPDDRKAAEAYSRGELIARAVPSFRAPFSALLHYLLSSGEGAGDFPLSGGQP